MVGVARPSFRRRVIEIVFSRGFPSQWFRLARNHTGETEILEELALPGRWRLTLLIHVAWVGDENDEGEEEEEDDDADDDPDVASAFGSEDQRAYVNTKNCRTQRIRAVAPISKRPTMRKESQCQPKRLTGPCYVAESNPGLQAAD